jgi:radical SAM superfamily enzyme YgiQ (UPF0313 family)
MAKEHSRALTVLGGIHSTIMPAETIAQQGVDFVARGEGERTIVELARVIEEGGSFCGVSGLSYKDNGGIFHNQPRELIPDLDSLPFPTRKLSKNYKYIYPDALHQPVYPIVTSRGCPGECSFCSINSIFKRKFRMRSHLNVVDEIEYLVRGLGAKEIHIWDDNFITDRRRVFLIRDELKRRNLKVFFAFPNGIRVDYVNEDLIRALKEMGTYSLAFGVESGNQAILDKINKKTDLKMIEDAFSLAKKYRIETWAFFILGVPGEDRKTIADSVKFAKKIKADVVKFHILKPFPGTMMHEELKDSGLIFNFNFDAYGIHEPPVHRLDGLAADELLKLQQSAYRKFYLRPQVILRHLARAKSLRRLELNFKVGFALLFRPR